MNKNDGLKFVIFLLVSTFLFIFIGVLSKTEKKSEITTKSEVEHLMIVTETLTREEETSTTAVISTIAAETEEMRENTDYFPSDFRYDGEWFRDGVRYTWYSERVLPGKGLNIPGRHSDGDFVRDEDEYICVASPDYPEGAVVDTPFGEGKVYDTGCPSGTIDIYVSW